MMAAAGLLGGGGDEGGCDGCGAGGAWRRRRRRPKGLGKGPASHKERAANERAQTLPDDPRYALYYLLDVQGP